MQAPAPPAGYQSNLSALYTQNAAAKPMKKTTRVLPQQPERVLDAPELLDNYYLNLLDWGSNNQVGSTWGPSTTYISSSLLKNIQSSVSRPLGTLCRECTCPTECMRQACSSCS